MKKFVAENLFELYGQKWTSTISNQMPPKKDDIESNDTVSQNEVPVYSTKDITSVAGGYIDYEKLNKAVSAKQVWDILLSAVDSAQDELEWELNDKQKSDIIDNLADKLEVDYKPSNIDAEEKLESDKAAVLDYTFNHLDLKSIGSESEENQFRLIYIAVKDSEIHLDVSGLTRGDRLDITNEILQHIKSSAKTNIPKDEKPKNNVPAKKTLHTAGDKGYITYRVLKAMDDAPRGLRNKDMIKVVVNSKFKDETTYDKDPERWRGWWGTNLYGKGHMVPYMFKDKETGNWVLSAKGRDQLRKLEAKFGHLNVPEYKPFPRREKTEKPIVSAPEKKGYVPRPGTSTEAVMNMLSDGGEYSLAEIVKKVGSRKPGQYGYGYSDAAVWHGVEYLVKKGVVKEVRKQNPRSGREANMYSLKNVTTPTNSPKPGAGKGGYIPQADSAAEKILNFLKSEKDAYSSYPGIKGGGEYSSTEVIENLGKKYGYGIQGRVAGNHPMTIQQALERLVEKGLVKVELKRNPRSNRMAKMYSAK